MWRYSSTAQTRWMGLNIYLLEGARRNILRVGEQGLSRRKNHLCIRS